MTLQDKKNYLAQYRSLNRRIMRNCDEINQLHSTSERVTTTLSYMPKEKNNNDRIQSSIEKIIEVEEELLFDIERFTIIRQKIIDAINSVENEKYREVLVLRYINGKTFENIAGSLNYTWRHIHRVHSNSLIQIKIK